MAWRIEMWALRRRAAFPRARDHRVPLRAKRAASPRLLHLPTSALRNSNVLSRLKHSMTPDEAPKNFTQNGVIPLLKQRPSDPSRLAPEDAYSPPRRERRGSPLGLGANGSVIAGTEAKRSRKRNGSRGRSGSRRRNRGWKKLLWVKQSCTFQSIKIALRSKIATACYCRK